MPESTIAQRLAVLSKLANSADIEERRMAADGLWDLALNLPAQIEHADDALSLHGLSISIAKCLLTELPLNATQKDSVTLMLLAMIKCATHTEMMVGESSIERAFFAQAELPTYH